MSMLYGGSGLRRTSLIRRFRNCYKWVEKRCMNSADLAAVLCKREIVTSVQRCYVMKIAEVGPQDPFKSGTEFTLIPHPVCRKPHKTQSGWTVSQLPVCLARSFVSSRRPR